MMPSMLFYYRIPIRIEVILLVKLYFEADGSLCRCI